MSQEESRSRLEVCLCGCLCRSPPKAELQRCPHSWAPTPPFLCSHSPEPGLHSSEERAQVVGSVGGWGREEGCAPAGQSLLFFCFVPMLTCSMNTAQHSVSCACSLFMFPLFVPIICQGTEGPKAAWWWTWHFFYQVRLYLQGLSAPWASAVSLGSTGPHVG